MTRPRPKRRGSPGRDTEHLIWLANGMSESGSLAEDRFWEAQIVRTIDTLLERSDEEAINAALDALYATNARAYEELADYIESRAEGTCKTDEAEQILLLAAPVLVWSRFRIPANTIPSAVLANLRVHLQAHILSKHARVALADFFFSPDQLPQGYCATADLKQALGDAAKLDQDMHIDTRTVPETAHFLSDTRYLLAAVAVPQDKPIFSWQENGGSRKKALDRWRNQGGASIVPLLPGCATEVVLPEAYFAASREADRQSRSYSIRASVAFLGAELETPAASLRAVIAPFHDAQLEEYRIGFSHREADQVVHGVVWPLLGAEDENSEIPAQIETVLRDCGVTNIVSLEHDFPMEYCEDCGTPMYPSADGEAVHPDMPESQADHPPRHLH